MRIESGNDVIAVASVSVMLDDNEDINITMHIERGNDVILVSSVPVVLDVEAICPGVQDCYHQYDRGLEVALYRKDFPQFCR